MAAGQTLFSAGALGAVTPSTGFATLDTRNERPVLDFDDLAIEAAHFSGVLPAHYSGGDLEVTLHWMSEDATSAVTRWRSQFERLEPGGFDLDGSDFQAAVSVNGTAVDPAGEIIATVITLTALDSAVAGDSFRLLIDREATHGDDLMANDAELLTVSIKEA